MIQGMINSVIGAIVFVILIAVLGMFFSTMQENVSDNAEAVAMQENLAEQSISGLTMLYIFGGIVGSVGTLLWLKSKFIDS